MKHAVIYIPGLGDSRVGGQRWAVKAWRLWGVESQLLQMNWAEGTFQPKFDHLLALIDELAKTHQVSLVAASAGATAAMNAFAARKDVVTGVVCIAGKINYPEHIGQGYKRQNPAFWESAQLTPEALTHLGPTERRRILSIRARYDPVVSAADSKLAGAVNRVTWTMGHVTTIATQLLFGAPRFLRFLKRQTTP